MRSPGPVQWRRVGLALMLAAGTTMLTTCSPALGSVNVVREAGLASTVAVEIKEQANKPGMARPRERTITDPATIEQLVNVLDQRLPLGPLAQCLPDYRLRFRLVDGRAEEFDYFCSGGASFLRGSQPFWKQREIRPPPEFDELMRRVVTEPE